MTLSTFTAGQVLTATALNNVHKQCVITCTSTTRPSSPPEGMTIYETDTDKMLVYTSATTGWVPPWNKPWGYIGQSKITTSTAATNANITTYSLTTVANRRYRITATTGSVSSSIANDIAGLYVQVGGTTISGVNIDCRTAASGVNGGTTIATYEPTTSATVTVAAYGARVSGTGTITWGATSTIPITLLVEDMGPNGAPA